MPFILATGNRGFLRNMRTAVRNLRKMASKWIFLFGSGGFFGGCG
jgi:hypothetical protein